MGWATIVTNGPVNITLSVLQLLPAFFFRLHWAVMGLAGWLGPSARQLVNWPLPAFTSARRPAARLHNWAGVSWAAWVEDERKRESEMLKESRKSAAKVFAGWEGFFAVCLANRLVNGFVPTGLSSGRPPGPVRLGQSLGQSACFAGLARQASPLRLQAGHCWLSLTFASLACLFVFGMIRLSRSVIVSSLAVIVFTWFAFC